MQSQSACKDNADILKRKAFYSVQRYCESQIHERYRVAKAKTIDLRKKERSSLWSGTTEHVTMQLCLCCLSAATLQGSWWSLEWKKNLIEDDTFGLSHLFRECACFDTNCRIPIVGYIEHVSFIGFFESPFGISEQSPTKVFCYVKST